MMYFVIAAMKGEPGAPPGPGGLAAPGGGEEGAQGEGWARLPERTYCPGLGAGALPGPSGLSGHSPVVLMRPGWGGGCEAPGSACWQPVLGFLLPREVKGDKRWRRLADLC